MAVGGLQRQYGMVSSPARWTGAQVGLVKFTIEQAVINPVPCAFRGCTVVSSEIWSDKIRKGKIFACWKSRLL